MPSAAPSPDNDYRFPPSPLLAFLDREAWDEIMGGTRGIGTRLRALELIGTGIAAIQAELQQFGLQRLDEAILPLITDTIAQLTSLQSQVAQQALLINNMIAAFQQEGDDAIAALNQQITASITALSANISALQTTVDTILQGGFPAANVTESATRVFVTPAQKAEIGQLRTDLAALSSSLTAMVTAIKFSTVRPGVWTTGNIAVGAGQRVIFNTASAAGNATLPANPGEGDTVDIGRSGINIVTILRNGKVIAGSASDYILDVDLVGVTLIYLNGSWRVIPWSLAT